MKPSMRQLIEALRLAADILDEQCYVVGRSFHFRLDGEWSLAISPDFAGRFRLDACHLSRPLATLWCFAGDRDRLETLIAAARAEAAVLA